MSYLKDIVYDIPLFELYNNIQQKVTLFPSDDTRPDTSYSVEYKSEDGVVHNDISKGLFELFRTIFSNSLDYQKYIAIGWEYFPNNLHTCFSIQKEGNYKINIKMIIKMISGNMESFHVRWRDKGEFKNPISLEKKEDKNGLEIYEKRIVQRFQVPTTISLIPILSNIGTDLLKFTFEEGSYIRFAYSGI